MSLTEPDFDVWADAIENFKSDKHERIQALINKYGWPLNGDDMDFKDSIEYDFIKPYLNEAKGTYRIAETPCRRRKAMAGIPRTTIHPTSGCCGKRRRG